MIEHIFFAIFDNKIGAKLVVQEPEEFAGRLYFSFRLPGEIETKIPSRKYRPSS